MSDALMDGCRRIEVRENLARNNGGYGIEIDHAIETTLLDNTAIDNAHPEQIYDESLGN